MKRLLKKIKQWLINYFEYKEYPFTKYEERSRELVREIRNNNK